MGGCRRCRHGLKSGGEKPGWITVSIKARSTNSSPRRPGAFVEEAADVLEVVATIARSSVDPRSMGHGHEPNA